MHQRKKRKKGGKKLKLIVLAIIILLGLSYYKYYSDTYSPVDESNNTAVSFQIKKGQTPKEIASALEEKNLINSSTSFYLYTKFHKLGENIIAGRFLLNKTLNTPEIINVISDPAQAEFIITIQEGLTVKDIDQKLVELGLIESSEFTQAAQGFNGWEYYPALLNQSILSNLTFPIEGYLYPDTYFLDPETFESKDLIYLALDNFEMKWNEIEKANSKLANYSPHEIITMASIIEREVRGEKDRGVVSGILWKRLENDWTLGADATLLYITDDQKISSSDLELESPYNTRKFKGLPPGPIGNPSISSINAALFPNETPYWFYLTTLDTGEVIYASTNEEHNANKDKYL
ncbi:endolytic transglycosylase MltG [Candidatus Peregrinibacteria bacterium]|nr:endolytic transglycosylase MltG [Candidatus Peregrinibacteria bacterium]